VAISGERPPRGSASVRRARGGIYYLEEKNHAFTPVNAHIGGKLVEKLVSVHIAGCDTAVLNCRHQMTPSRYYHMSSFVTFLP
jgi:hypothetical protein